MQSFIRKAIVLIELKTNKGWERPKKDNWSAMQKRFRELESRFEVLEENIFLILETATNESATCLNYWWDKDAEKKHSLSMLPSIPIFEQVIPLLFKADPYY